ncbi:MAG: hypothetical protein ACREL1_00995 [bacterium]
MSSDELFPETPQAPSSWDALEKRINRLLESVVQLRNSNGQLMKENMALKNQLKDKAAPPPAVSSVPPETEKLRKDYGRALDDLKKIQNNLLQMESLAAELRNGKSHSDLELL